jgi:hypothetical protein
MAPQLHGTAQHLQLLDGSDGFDAQQPLFVHGYTIPASKGESVVLIPIALHGDTDLLDGAINAPGVDMGEV